MKNNIITFHPNPIYSLIESSIVSLEDFDFSDYTLFKIKVSYKMRALDEVSETLFYSRNWIELF